MNLKQGQILNGKYTTNSIKILDIHDWGITGVDTNEIGVKSLTWEMIKRDYEVPEEKWVPEEEEEYFFIDHNSLGLFIRNYHYESSSSTDVGNIGQNNYFKTKEEAEAKLKEILKVLKK
jgi:hypothetical protein